MARPAVPAPGDLVDASWAGDVVDYIGAAWRYVPNPTSVGMTSRGTVPGATAVALELTELPANDPRVVAAVVAMMIRETSTASVVLSVYDGATRTVRYGYTGTTGYASRGGPTAAFIVPVGGTNGRSIGVASTASSTGTYWLSVLGWYVVDAPEPAVGSSDPVVSFRLPVDPAPGDELAVDWAADLLALAGRGWRYVINPAERGVVLTATQDVDLETLGLPADPRVVAGSVSLTMRGSSTSTATCHLYELPTEYLAGRSDSTGVAARFSASGPFVALLNGQTKVRAELAGSVQDVTLHLRGWWLADSELDA